MVVRKMDLHKRCLFVLSGVCNALGTTLATELCRQFRPGSCCILIGASEEKLQEVKKEIEYLEKGIGVVCCNVGDWQTVDALSFKKILNAITSKFSSDYFELAFVVHNEGYSSTDNLMEPQDSKSWLSYVQENLFAVIALNQEFLKYIALFNLKKLVVNITSSLLVQPFVYNSLMCSCKKARDMYFRAMAAVESRTGVLVMNYSPGIFDSHKPMFDLNNNIVDLVDLNPSEKLLNLPRIQPVASALKLVNILQDLSFCPGHDVDYYDTYNL